MMGLDAALRAIKRQKAWIARLRRKKCLGAEDLIHLNELELLLDRDRERLLHLQARLETIQ